MIVLWVTLTGLALIGIGFLIGDRNGWENGRLAGRAEALDEQIEAAHKLIFTYVEPELPPYDWQSEGAA